MKKYTFRIIVIFLAVLSIVLVSLFSVIPSYYKNTYENKKTAENLYNLCKYVYTFKNTELIIKYYPVLLFDTDYNEYSWESEKDNMLSELLDTSLKKSEYDVFKEYLSKACKTYSNDVIAEEFVVVFIWEYYDQSNNLEKTYELFESVIDSFPNSISKVSICSEYAYFARSNTDDTEKFEEIYRMQKELAAKASESHEELYKDWLDLQ